MTPGSAVRHVSATRHVTHYATWPGILPGLYHPVYITRFISPCLYYQVYIIMFIYSGFYIIRFIFVELQMSHHLK